METTTVHIKLPDRIMEKVRKIAEYDRRTVHNLLRNWIEDACNLVKMPKNGGAK